MSKVSIFKNAKSPDSATDRILVDILHGIKNGEWEDIITRYRSMVNTFGKRSMQDKSAKPTIPGFTVSGTFTRREDACMKKHSGFVAVDIDDLYEKTDIIKEVLSKDKYTYCVFTSTGGNGLCVILKVDPSQHSRKLFDEIEEYLITQYDIQIDYLSDLSRFRFVSYDPELYLFEESKMFLLGREKEQEYIPNGEAEKFTYWSNEEQIDFAEKIVQRDKQFIEGERHKYILSLSKLLNKLGISQSETTDYINYTYPHFKDNPSNAIQWVYNNKKGEFGSWKKKSKRVKEEPLYVSEELKLPSLDISQEITFSFNPPKTSSVVTLNDIRFCSIGNVSSIIALPGIGKSQTCESIGAAFINPNCDALGFSVELPDNGNFLYIDGERTHEDCKRGFDRIGRRADIKNNPSFIDGDRLKRFQFHSFIAIGDTKQRKKELERLIEETKPKLVLLDDITMIIQDINDNKEADTTFRWLVALANKYMFALICTIHANPKDETFKPRGHIGTRVMHISESVYLLRRASDNKDVKRLTTDFEYGKSRNATDVNEVNYQWSDEKMMFVSCDYEMKVVSKSAISGYINYSDRFSEIWLAANNPKQLRGSDLLERYSAGYDVSTRTANRHIKDAVDLEILDKLKDGKATFYTFKSRSDIPF